MIAPTTDPSWATDSTVLSGSEATLPVRVEPSTGVRAQGFQADLGLAARTANALLGAQGDWIKFLREANGSPLSDTPRAFRIPVTMACTLTAPYFVSFSDTLGGGSGIPGQAALTQSDTNRKYIIPLGSFLPKNCNLYGISMQVWGGTGWTSLPDVLPSLSLNSVPDAGSVSTLLTVNDTSSLAATFQAVHNVTVGVTPIDLSVYDDLSLVIQGAVSATWHDLVYYRHLLVFVTSKSWS